MRTHWRKAAFKFYFACCCSFRYISFADAPLRLAAVLFCVCEHTPVWLERYTFQYESFSVHTACLPACFLCLPLSVSLSSSVQAFPALAQVQSLRRVNECLLAENRAMLRVLARLSETASMPETEDLWSSGITCSHSSPSFPLLCHITSTLLFPSDASSAPSSSAVFLSGRSCTLPVLTTPSPPPHIHCNAPSP